MRRGSYWRRPASRSPTQAWRCCTSGPRAGSRATAGGDLACGACRPGAVRVGVLWQRARRCRLPAGGGAGAPAERGARALAAHIRARAREWPARRRARGGSGSERILQQLEDDNAFVTSLDAGRSWFRYHHLFADLLRLELRRSDPASVDPLHRKAAQWYEKHGYPVDAIRHAQAAKDWPHAARLLAESSIGLRLDGRQATVHALLAAFPAEVPAENAELALVFAADRVLDGAFEEAAAYLAAAETAAGAVTPDRRWHLDLERAGMRLSLARRQGDLEAATEAMQSLEAASKARPASDVGFSNDHRATALMNLGIAELWSVRLPEAQRHLEDGLTLARRIERPYLEVGSLAHLAMAALLTGCPASVALQRSEEAVAIAETHGWATDPVASAAFAVAGQVLVRLGRFAEAERWLERAEDALHPGEPGTELVLRISQGLLEMGRGRLDDALAAFRAGEQMQALLAGEHMLTAEVRNRILQIQLRMDETAAGPAALARVATLAADRAGARITTAAVHLAEGNPQEAVEELAPVIARRGDGASPGMGSPGGVAVRRRSARSARRQARCRGVDRTSARPRRARRGHPAVRPCPRARPASAPPA